jgi:hypothetical protein
VYSLSGQETCTLQGCSNNAQTGELLLGNILVEPANVSESVSWYHPQCLLEALHGTGQTLDVPLEEIEGFSSLRLEDQSTLRHLMQEPRMERTNSPESVLKKRKLTEPEAASELSKEQADQNEDEYFEEDEDDDGGDSEGSSFDPSDAVSDGDDSPSDYEEVDDGEEDWEVERWQERQPPRTKREQEIKPKPAVRKGTGPLKDLIFSIIGRFSVGHKQLADRIEENGGTVLTSVTRAVTHLLASPGEESTTKYKKAITRGIPIVNEKMLGKIIAGELPPPPPAEGTAKKRMKRL